jgi:hypothetical protein
MDAMAPVRHHSGMDMVRTTIAAWMAALALLLVAAAGPAQAQRVEGDRAEARGVYQAEVPVRSQGEADRHRGFARALAEVLGKLSGDRRAADRAGVAAELGRAGDFVDSYDYRQDEGVSAATGAPTYGTTLIVRFDPDRVQDMASALGLPVWPTPRPKPVLWLAIDDGSGPRLVGLPKADAARSLLDRAIERGFRLGLPSGSAAEQAAVGAIWRGDVGAIARISSRYNPPMQLIGKLYREGNGWAADWIFVNHGKVLDRWSTDDRSARQAMSGGADGAADALAARYAKASAPIGEPGRYLVRFTGLDDARDYMRLSAWLQRQTVVQDIVPKRASAGMVEFELQLSTGLPGLRRAVDDELLEPAGEGEPVTFRVR